MTSVAQFRRNYSRHTAHGRRVRRLLAAAAVLALLALPASGIAEGFSDENLLSQQQQRMASIDAWASLGGATLQHSLVVGFAGDTSLQATVGGGASEVALTGPGVAVEGGAEYAGAVRVRPSTRLSAARCTLTYADAAGSPLATEQGAPVQQEAGRWAEVECGGLAPDDATRVMLGVTLTGVAAGDVHHLDDVWIVQRAPRPPDPDPEPAPDTPVVEAENLLTADQHSFENSISGWTPQGNSTLARKVGTGYVGDASLMVLADRSGPWPDSTRTVRAGTDHQRGRGVPVSAGTEYLATWRIKPHQVAAPARCELRFYNNGGKILHTYEGEMVPAALGTWTRASCRGVAPQSSSYAAVRVLIAETDYGTVFYVDDAWLVDATALDGLPGNPGEEAPGPTEEPAPDPTEEPDPDPTEEPAPPGDAPEHGRFVDASNTGVTAYHAEDLGRPLRYSDLQPSGSVTTTHDGQVIERLDVTGSIVIHHDDVVVRASRVSQQTYYAISGSGRRATIEFVELDGRHNPDWIGILYGPDWTVRRSEVRGHNTGVRLRPGGTLESSYVHSQVLKQGSHNAAASFHGGHGVRVLNNNLIGSTSSALSLYPDVPIVDALVEGNLFNDGSYCVYAGYGPKPGSSESREIRHIDNVFAQSPYALCGHYGPYVNWDGSKPGNVWRDNRYEDGTPVPG